MKATIGERQLLELLRRMLARPEYLLPIVAAERQLRAYYYRLNAAALLEDLFHDALNNYIKQHEPQVPFLRAGTGTKGWDYEIDGIRIAHKSFSGGGIAAIWDPTLRDRDTWDFEASLLVVVVGYRPKTWSLKSGDEVHKVTSLASRFPGRKAIEAGAGTPEGISYLVHWPSDGGSATILLSERVDKGQRFPWETLGFAELWRGISSRSPSQPLNECEILVARKTAKQVVQGQVVDVSESELRPGVYLVPKTHMQGVPVKANNRGLLVHKNLFSAWLLTARKTGLFTPMPLWYQAYAEDRPPDMYSVQRTEYDALFSARGFRR